MMTAFFTPLQSHAKTSPSDQSTRLIKLALAINRKL